MTLQKGNLTTGPVGQKIISLTLPMMIGMVGMVIFNLVDTFFVGMLGTDALAAMSFTLPVVLLQGSISMGLGVGASAVISRAIGSGDKTLVKRLTTDSLVLSLVIVIFFITAGLLTIRPLFSAMGAKEDILLLISQYMSVWYLGVPFVVIPMIGNNAIRAAGNTMIPSLVMLTAILINVILDPLLIFGYGPFPRMELAGAALATLIARATTLILSLLVLHFRFDMLTIRIPKSQELFDSWKKVLYIGIPAAITQIILPLSMGIITRIVAVHGKAAVAALGVGTRIEMFALSPLTSLAAVLIPFIGQNAGAGNQERIKKGINFANLFSLCLGAVMFLLFLFTGKGIGRIFNKETEVVNIIYLYLVIVSAGYAFQGMLMISTSALNALRKPFHSAILNLIRMGALYIPLALLGSRYIGITGVFIGAALSSLIAGIIAMLWVRQKT